MAVAAEVRAELARQEMTVTDLANRLGWRYETLRGRVSEATEFKDTEITAVGMALGVPGWELMRRAAEAGRLESVDEIAAGLINDEGWDE